MTKILLATNNKGKLVEMQSLLEGAGMELVTPRQLGLDLEVEENGRTYAENAALKGRAFAQASGLLTLADDSGLEVDALEGRPGLYSARFNPKPGASDADRRDFLLEQLSDHPYPWTARFRCVVAVVSPGGETRFAEGVCEGEIIPEERGDNGFGYDPIFLPDGFDVSAAELAPEVKNAHSHRARAFRALLPELERVAAERDPR